MSETVSSQQQQAIGPLTMPRAWLKALWKFSRPHTIIGTSLSVWGLYVIAAAFNGFERGGLGAALLAWISCLGANLYIVGLNQITDVEIDRINKPDLPLASGAFSPRMGWSVVIGGLLVALALALWQGQFLLVTVGTSLLIGTAYSLPPIRLKRFHFWAAACIFTVRGVVVNLFLFLHFQTVLGDTAVVPPHVWALTAFVFGLSLVIAWFKDIPDMEGDGRFRIATLTLRLGPRRVFFLGLALLTACYLGLAAAGLLGLPHVNGPALAVIHLALLALLWVVALRVDPTQKPVIARFYLFVWGLFFSEYIFFPLACVLAA